MFPTQLDDAQYENTKYHAFLVANFWLTSRAYLRCTLDTLRLCGGRVHLIVGETVERARTRSVVPQRPIEHVAGLRIVHAVCVRTIDVVSEKGRTQQLQTN